MSFQSIDASAATALADAVADAVVPEIAPAVNQAIVDQCNPGGAIRGVVRPLVYGSSVTLTGGADLGGGATRYELVAANPPGRSTMLLNLRIKSDIAIVFSVWSGVADTVIQGDQTLAAGEEWDLSSAEIRAFHADDGDAVTLRVSDLNAIVEVTYRAATLD